MFISDIEKVLELSEKEYYNNFSYIMQTAIIKDVTLYTDLIDQLYEIGDRDYEILKDILLRTNNLRKLIVNLSQKEGKADALSFGYILSEAIGSVTEEDLTDGELLALGCIAQAFISYQKNWLTKDEFYEIRDMYVPFNLPISVTKLNIDEVIIHFKTNNSDTNGQYSMVLLKKIGKTVVDNTVTVNDIRAALEELNFDEAW